MGSLRVSANQDTCVTSSLCVYRVPQVFDQDEDGLVLVVNAEPPQELREDLLHAQRSCPTRSIRIEEPAVGAGADVADSGSGQAATG
ncbi:ferredoxin [Streptomyces sp. DSM 41987]|uniref:ferredoxin n=1 Tax=Streptomyces TaxID=1883 RepID=UPI00361E9548